MAREYKDSGIEWIGQIPKEWEVKKVKYVSDSINKGNGITKEEVFADGDTPCVRYGEIYSKYNTSFDNCVSATRIEIQKSPRYFNKGDILFAGTGELVEEIGKNIVYLGENPCLAGGDIIVLSHHQSPSFLNYALNCHSSQAQKSRNKAKLKVVHISASEIGDILIALPSLPIQQKIADYLDKVCGEVDEMVALQETMIEELKAYKQSVITEAVTKGLNPNVPMRDSGIDWIGEIPEYWEVIKLSFLTSKIGSGSTPTGGANVYVHEGVKFLRSQNVYFEGLNLNDVAFITETIDEEMKGTRVKPGDILLNITGGSIGRCYYVDESLGRANVNQHVSIIRPTKIETIYLKYYLQSDLGQNQIALLQTGGNREGLSAAALSNFKISFPPISEQRAISSYLDTKCSEIDALIAMKQAKIEELKEYKKSVIYEYVTGKKEVC